MRYFIELSRVAESYEALIYSDNRALGRPRPGLALGPQATVSIKGRSATLGELVELLVDPRRRQWAERFDQRGQLELGHYLYHQLFAETRPAELQRAAGESLELRIITSDEHLMRLPWALLAHEGIFLATEGWAVTLTRPEVKLQQCALPPNPRMLVIAPEPAGVSRTRAEAHMEELERRLSISDHHLRMGDHLRMVTTWEEFRACLPEFRPQLLYFYGHALGDSGSLQLLFADQEQRRIEKPITDLVQALRQLPELPLLVYVNCCDGTICTTTRYWVIRQCGWSIGETPALYKAFVRPVAASRARRPRSQEQREHASALVL